MNVLINQLFEDIDEEIRESYNWSKDMIQQLTARVESLARKHLGIVKDYLRRLADNHKDFYRM